MTKPVVTIIITVFKRTEYLAEAIKSAVDQTYQNLEIIVTDDSNLQLVREICSSFASDNRVRYRNNPSVLGAPLNIRAALEETSGEYIVILNDDDMMESFMVATLVPPLLVNPSCVVSFADHWIVNEQGAVSVDESTQNTRRWGRDTVGAGIVTNPFALAIRGGIPLLSDTVLGKIECSRSGPSPS